MTVTIPLHYEISAHGMACFSVVADGVHVVFDPHDGRSLGLPPPPARVADVVLVTHAHADHNAGKARVAKTDAPVLEAAPGDWEKAGIHVHGVRVRHGEPEDWGSTVVYTVRFPGGLVVLHGGDMGFVPTAGELADFLTPGWPEVAFLPVGGTYTLDAAGAVETARLLAPRKTTVACHFLHGPLLELPEMAGMTDERPFLALVGEAKVTWLPRGGALTETTPCGPYAVFEYK